MNTVSDRNEAWRDELRRSMAAKDRVAIERVVMPETPPAERIKSQRIEVNKGLTAEMAVTEARRCMDCVTPTCMEGCPVGIDIPGFIKNIEREDFLRAAAVLKRTSALPSVCGRVCPQEKQCESKCFYIQKLKKKPVAIGYLERFAADYERESGHIAMPELAPANGIKVGVIGSGPSGLSCAGDLAKLGYDVTVFEALHEIGGVLKYGIPEFRLPNRIVDVEIDNLKKMGVKFVTDFVVGMTDSVADLEAEGFKAFYIASGAGLPRFMNIPGENYNGILSSNEYLTRVNLMGADQEDSDTPVYHGKHVVVVGGGNTAMDSVRTAKRLGAARAVVVYPRSEQEMPATDVAKAKRMPLSSWGMLWMVPSALLKSTLVRPCISPINVPRMPSEVKRPGMSSASWAWPGFSTTVSSLMYSRVSQGMPRISSCPALSRNCCHSLRSDLPKKRASRQMGRSPAAVLFSSLITARFKSDALRKRG